MQNLEIISVNIWQIVISLANLLILFLIVKKFLYKPVKKLLKSREDAINKQYEDASIAQKTADENKAQWEEKMLSAEDKADAIIKEAATTATARGDEIVADAKAKASDIIKDAETEAQLERRRAEKDIKEDIVDLSTKLTEKMLSREIKAQDHKELIDSFIDNIGESDE